MAIIGAIIDSHFGRRE